MRLKHYFSVGRRKELPGEIYYSSVLGKAAVWLGRNDCFGPMAAPATHVSRIRSLYKRILVLHRFLPIHLRAFGDQYVKEEFRRHKSASPEEVKSFLSEWEVTEAFTRRGTSKAVHSLVQFWVSLLW